MLKKRSLLTVLLSSFALLVLALVLIISAVPDSTAKAAEIEGMKGSFFCNADPEALGFKTADKNGRKVDTDILSAKFGL